MDNNEDYCRYVLTIKYGTQEYSIFEHHTLIEKDNVKYNVFLLH